MSIIFGEILGGLFESKIDHRNAVKNKERSSSTVSVLGFETQPKAPQLNCRFLSKNESIIVQGHTINGLVYVSSPGTSVISPAVINPILEAQKSSTTEPLAYWPSYSSISSAQRFRYLNWLAGDRGISEIIKGEIGYIFLYFYGFERYVLKDAKNDLNKNQNLVDIVVEIHRLRSFFSGNRSFDSYSNQLLDAIYILFYPDQVDDRKVSFPASKPLAAKYIIAKKANDTGSGILDADWALHWLLGYGPVKRSKDIREKYPILRSLFRAVYEAETNGGITVPSCNTKMLFTINTASKEFHDIQPLPFTASWCDPTNLKKPMMVLVAIYEKIIPSLKLLTKSVAINNTAGILAAWPPGTPTDSVPKLNQLVQNIIYFYDKNNIPKLHEIASVLGMEINGKATKSQIKQIASALETCGLVMVPDPLINSTSLSHADRVVLYKSTRLETLSNEGYWIALCVQLGSLLVLQDGVIHKREKAILENIIHEHPEVSERSYLIMYLEWRLTQSPSTLGIKKQINRLTKCQCDELEKILVYLGSSDDHLNEPEIHKLQKLFSKLGLDPENVSKIQTSSMVPSLNNITQTENQKILIQASGAGLQLDPFALKAHSESTKEIQSVLNNIFVEDEDEDTENLLIRVSDKNSHWYSGFLDQKHQVLVAWLLTKDEWPINSINEKCQELELLSDGALETINNAAFDVFGEGLLEIGETVEIYHDILPD